jgi:hydroxyethylthiazole kinase-like uncharacterized protein yjeF
MTEVVALTADELKRHPLPPVAEGDKDSHGRLLLIAGSRELPGAPLLTAIAALRAGAGKLKIATVASAALPLGMAIPEAMVRGLAEARDGGLAKSAIADLGDMAKEADAIVAGPGMTASATSERVAARLCRSGAPLVLDAGMLRALPRRRKDAQRSDCSPVLLPHSGEMASLLDCSAGEVESDPVQAGLRCAERYDAIVLVKGPKSHIATASGSSWHYDGGGPGLGVSGSGDVLAGIVGGLMARGTVPLTALLWGVWLHGEAGRSLARKVGPIGFLAREISNELPALLAQASLE